MGLFSHKTKTDAVQFARGFYDEFVFGPDPAGGDFMLMIAETNQRLINEADPSFAEVDLGAFKDELLAMRLEMIQTAWTHGSKDEPAIAISKFTREYLADKQWDDLWEVMTDYNQAVAESATFRADGNTRTGRATITFVNVSRTNLFDALVTKGHDSDAVARVVNRFGSLPKWKAGIVQGLVAIRLTRHLNLEGSQAIWEPLSAVAHGFYRGAKEALEGVTLTA